MLAAAPWILAALACSRAGDPRSFAEAEPAVLIVDADATQAGVDGFPGAVFALDPASWTVRIFCADPRFSDPQRIVPLGDDAYLLTDFDADPNREGTRGAVFRLDAGGAVTATYTSTHWVAPTAVVMTSPTDAYITDRRARPRSDGEGQGAVFHLDLKTGDVDTLAADPRFRAPADVIAWDDGRLLVLDADAKVAPGEEGVLFQIDPQSGEVTDTWPLAGTISPLSMLREPTGDLLIFDVNADPRHVGGPLGAVFRFSVDERSTALVASPLVFRDPVGGCLDEDGSVLLVDANADPMKRGPDAAGRGQNLTGGGALFRLDRESGALQLLVADERFVNPVDVLRVR